MLVTPYVTCNDTCVWFHIDTRLPGGSVRYGVSRDEVEEGSRARKRNLGMKERVEEGGRGSGPYAELAKEPGHRCPTPQTTSLCPALNVNQLALVRYNIFPR